MLINNNRKMLVWQPFKNYSTSLADYLTSNRIFRQQRFVFVQGPVPYLENDVLESEHEPSLGHTNWFPKRATGYTKILPIRNPYFRVVSQWKHALKYSDGLSFDEWLLRHSKQLIQFPVSKMYRYDKLIKVENIEQELKDLSLFNNEYDFPHNNKSDDVDFELNQEHKKLIYFLHQSDFEAGGYSK